MRKIAFIILALLVWSSLMLAFGQEVYRWVDEKGVVHFTDDLTRVPEKYRSQVQQKAPSKEPPPSTSSRPVGLPKTTEQGEETLPGPKAVLRDSLGRGEEWWRARAKEWNEKLKAAQRDYEAVYNEWKAKEQELEDSRFKPDSAKRKLQSEIKSLQEKVRDQGIQMDEAKNMVENVLPKEAREYRANPEWLKVEENR